MEFDEEVDAYEATVRMDADSRRWIVRIHPMDTRTGGIFVLSRAPWFKVPRDTPEEEIIRKASERIARKGWPELPIRVDFSPLNPIHQTYRPDLDAWKPLPCQEGEVERFHMEVSIPLETSEFAAFKTPEEQRQSIQLTEIGNVARALQASYDFEVRFGYGSNGSGVGFGYRDMVFYALTREQADKLKPVAEVILESLGYEIGEEPHKARVELESVDCREFMESCER